MQQWEGGDGGPQLKDALRARSAANDWPDHLPWVLLGMRAAPKKDSAVSSAEMVLGDPLVLPGQLPTAEPLPPPQRSYRDALLEGPTRHVPTRPLRPAQSGLPAACRSVHVRRCGNLPPLTPLYAGHYAILERGEKTKNMKYCSNLVNFGLLYCQHRQARKSKNTMSRYCP
jgi:hypothetical protein